MLCKKHRRHYGNCYWQNWSRLNPAPSFLFYFHMPCCYCWILMCERLTEKGEFWFWSAFENKILEPCTLERQQPPHLAAHWPQSHYWDFQNADEMAFAKILRTRMEMYILVYLMEHTVSLQRAWGCVSLLSCYGNASPNPENSLQFHSSISDVPPVHVLPFTPAQD